MAPATRKSRVQPVSARELHPEPIDPLSVNPTEPETSEDISAQVTESTSPNLPPLPEDTRESINSPTASVRSTDTAQSSNSSVAPSLANVITPGDKGKGRGVPECPPTPPFSASSSPAPRSLPNHRTILELSDDSDTEKLPPSEEFLRDKAKANRDALYAEDRRSLGEALEQTLEDGRLRRAARAAASQSTSSSNNPLLVPTDNGTGFPVLDRVMNDLECSIKAYWIGQPEVIEENCHWVQDGYKPNFVLRYKEDAVVQPEGYEPHAPAVIAWVGRVSGDGSTLTPEAGYSVNFEFGDASKRKWITAVSRPPPEMRMPQVFWTSQMTGATSFIDSGRRAMDGKELLDVGYSFFDNTVGGLRARSPVFLPYHIPVPGSDDGDDFTVPEREAGVPEQFRFATWKFASNAVKTAFREVVERGFDPQLFEAYDSRDERIHINDVQATLANAMVCVFCTMEKALFRGRAQPGGKAWQFYANLVKVQVLKRPLAIASAPRKRPMIKGYKEDDERQPGTKKVRMA
ncbi:unnamed protein product [Rhizoctonia solani]|uniref:Uncharacterized protein n=1 Tax=Rhizoctonia solani TaxID=456999 RepID=A0A8H3AHP8_9AGAM|nr:unnamed protein product [Rhizoctonia solani]